MASINSLALSLIFTAIFFYVLYFIVRAAVRDGIRQAGSSSVVGVARSDEPDA